MASKKKTTNKTKQQKANPWQGIEMPGFGNENNLFASVWQKFISEVNGNPELMADMASRHAGYQAKLMASLSDPSNGKANGDDKDGKKPDRRFSHPEWHANPFYRLLKENYEFNSQMINEAAQSVDLDTTERQALSFMLNQIQSAMAPTNFPMTNPEVAEATINSNGENLRQGIQNYMEDMKAGGITTSDPDAFEVGVNLATTPGKVILQNHVMQLIEYTPTTAKVHKAPLLIVPPCINKYYIIDLNAEDSLINYLLNQGIRVYIISWVNADQEHQNLGWDDYVSAGVIEAVDTVCDVTDQKTINTIGYCIGGTLLASAYALMKANKDKRIASLSLLTSFIDFCDTGDIGLFVDEKFVTSMERKFAEGGIFSGVQLKTTFAYLRPDDLVWPYVVKNYMLGKTPPPFNILHWNSDSTNLPGKMYSWYLRHTYLDNDLKKKVDICGEQVQVANLGVPGMVVSCERDHIVPWQAAYASAELLGKSKATFVLASSGHVAGVINPPYKKKGYHYVAKKATGDLPNNADSWLKSSNKIEGSWWPTFASWLKKRSSTMVVAPKKAGNYRHMPISDAPGSYVTADLPKAS